jgi:tetratricopeptide (TPR) repeat protein
MTPQSRRIDSLFSLLKTDKEDTNKVNHLCLVAYDLRNADPKKVMELCEQAGPLIEKFNFKRGEADMNIAMGAALANMGKKEEALSCFLKATRLSMHNKFHYQLAKAYYGTGITYQNYGEYPQALDYFNQALGIALKLNNDEKFISNIYNYLGLTHDGLGNTNEALKSFLTAIEIKTRINDKQGIASACNNVVGTYKAGGNLGKAIEAANVAIKINLEMNNKQWLANNYVNLGGVYMQIGTVHDTYLKMRDDTMTMLDYLNQSEKYHLMAYELKKGSKDKRALADIQHNLNSILYQKAIYHTPDPKKQKEMIETCLNSYKEVVKVREELGDKENLSKAANKVGSILTYLKKYDEAKKWMQYGLKVALEMRSKVSISSSYFCLTELDSLSGNYRGAMRDAVMYKMYQDSVQKENDGKKNVQMQLFHEYNLKQTADSLKNAEQAKHEKLKYDQEIKQQKYFTWGGIIGFSMMLIVAGVSLRAYRQKRKDNNIITQQKSEVEVKQKEILDSIHYAKRIQDSLLPQEKYIDKNLQNLKKDLKG